MLKVPLNPNQSISQSSGVDLSASGGYVGTIFSISISIYFVQNQVGLHSQKTNEQDNQAHNMLSQLPAVTDRKVKQQYNWKKYI